MRKRSVSGQLENGFNDFAVEIWAFWSSWRSGCPSVTDDDQLETVIEKDLRKITRREQAKLQFSQKNVSNHLYVVRKSIKLDKWVPHDFNENQEIGRSEICSSLLISTLTDPFLDRYATSEEKWILYNNDKNMFFAVVGLKWYTENFPANWALHKEGYGNYLVVYCWIHPP